MQVEVSFASIPALKDILPGVSREYLLWSFNFEKESLKTTNWRRWHNQPLDQKSLDHICRLCQSSKETETHSVHDCPNDQARQARRLVKSY